EDFEIALIDEFQDTDARQWNIFKNIFMFGEKHRLMLIGDPKQAIYGFRGADIHTYELAKKELLELGDERTQIWSLATNYRTVPDLIENLNVAWQHFLPNQIAQVRPMPSDHMDPVRILSDNTGTYSFNFLEDEESMPLGSAGDLKYYYANKIAETCKTLLSPDALIFESKNLVQSLQASDICILVRGKNEVPYLEQALKIQEIPCSFYKKPGIYHSKAAMHFTVLIEGLIIQKSTYINRALLTCFFEYSPEEVLQLQETGQAINLWQELTEITRTKNWARFFHALFYKSGLLKRLKQEQEHRLLMDLKQITDVLCKSAIERNLDLEGLLRHFNNLKEEEGEEDFHQRETDSPMVQIMTMHASKGLEFPIVFIYGGFTQGVASPSYHKYYDEFEDRLVYDLACQNKEAHDREVIEENKRLFYVAMTRAKLKLFLPYYADELEERFKGSYSTLINDDLLQYMAKQDLEPNHEGYFSSGVPEMNTREKESDDFNLQPPKSLEDGALRARYIESFSGLSQQGDVLNWLAYSDASVDEAKVDDIEIGEQSNRGIGLPRGAHVGNVLHDTLEFIDFPTVMQAQSPSVLYANTEVEQLILNLMKKYRLPSSNTEGQSCFEMMCDQVWHILQTKLLLGDQVLQLGFLSEKDRKHELEFYYHAPENSYLKGFIDLLFRVGNNYYILDWKSNYSENGYTHDILFNEVMREHQYQLQYELYRLAVQEWFDTLGLKEAKLCGAIYIFARGMHVDNVAGHGYVFDDFSNLNNETTRTHLQQLLLKRIGGRA
ncbi:MAG: UvrD-helicase domain-containing protein, partial [Lentisphaeria bacterium]|nr:UvrD-helicase domain-containing protein [Lentisphaeria bacterium]